MNYDLVIKGGRIIDGTANPWYYGNVAVSDGKIACIGKHHIEANKVIDANGLVVAPGFIDSHSHADTISLVYRKMESALMQGITTIISGHCGVSMAPVTSKIRKEVEKETARWLPTGVELKITWATFDEYLRIEEATKLGTNMAHFVGHEAVRISAMGYETREPDKKELECMRGLLSEAMEAGALGLSTGLIYPPGVYTNTDELIELAKVVSGYGGIYTSHIRGEGKTLFAAVEEAIRIGEEAKIPVQISHHKAAHRTVWGKSNKTLEMMEDARRKGVDVTFDQYPYTASSTSLVTLLPPWVHAGGMDKLLERLRDPDIREKIRKDIETDSPEWENDGMGFGWERIYVSSVKTEVNKSAEGHNLAEIKQMRHEASEFSTLFNLILEEDGAVGMIVFSMDEQDVQRIMAHPLGIVGTDSSATSPTGVFANGKPHPRCYGTCPRILGHYVRELGVLRLEEAIRKMTSAPAQRFGLWDRGIIRPGFIADITIFNPDTVIDKAVYNDPHKFPEGIEYVIINGTIVVEKGKNNGILAGRTIRKKR